MQISVGQTTKHARSGPKQAVLLIIINQLSIRVQLSTTPRASLVDGGGDYNPFDFLAINALTLFKEFSLAWISLFALATSILL